MSHDYGRYMPIGSGDHGAGDWLASITLTSGQGHVFTVPDNEIPLLTSRRAPGRFNPLSVTYSDGATTLATLAKAERHDGKLASAKRATYLETDPLTRTALKTSSLILSRGTDLGGPETRYFLPESSTGLTGKYGEFVVYSEQTGALDALYDHSEHVAYLNDVLLNKRSAFFAAEQLFRNAVAEYKAIKRTGTAAAKDQKLEAIHIAHEKFLLAQAVFNNEIVKRTEHKESLLGGESILEESQTHLATFNLNSTMEAVAPRLPVKQADGDPLRANAKYARDLWQTYRDLNSFFEEEGQYASDSTKTSLLYSITRELQKAFTAAPEVACELSTDRLIDQYRLDLFRTRNFTDDEFWAEFEQLFMDKSTTILPNDFLKRVPEHLKEIVETFWGHKLKRITEKTALEICTGPFKKFAHWVSSCEIKARAARDTGSSLETAAKAAAKRFGFAGESGVPGGRYEEILPPSHARLAETGDRDKMYANTHSVNISGISAEIDGIALNLSNKSSLDQLVEAMAFYDNDRNRGLFGALEAKFIDLQTIHRRYADDLLRHVVGTNAWDIDSDYKKAKKDRDTVYANRLKYTKLYYQKLLEQQYNKLSDCDASGNAIGHKVASLRKYQEIVRKIERIHTEMFDFYDRIADLATLTPGTLSKTKEEFEKIPDQRGYHAARISRAKHYITERVDALSTIIEAQGRTEWRGLTRQKVYDQGEVATLRQRITHLTDLRSADALGLPAAAGTVEASQAAFNAAKDHLESVDREYSFFVRDTGEGLKNAATQQRRSAAFHTAVETPLQQEHALMQGLTRNLSPEIDGIIRDLTAIPADGGAAAGDAANQLNALALIRDRILALSLAVSKKDALEGDYTPEEYNRIEDIITLFDERAAAIAGVLGDLVADVPVYSLPDAIRVNLQLDREEDYLDALDH